MHKPFSNRAREMARERSRGQPGTVEIGPVEPRELNTPGSPTASLAKHFEGIREVSSQALKLGCFCVCTMRFPAADRREKSIREVRKTADRGEGVEKQ